jgi:hypothetical protein
MGDPWNCVWLQLLLEIFVDGLRRSSRRWKSLSGQSGKKHPGCFFNFVKNLQFINKIRDLERFLGNGRANALGRLSSADTYFIS